MPVATIDLSKGWLPDIPPFELPNGALSDTDNIWPSALGYRGITYSAGVNTTVNALCAGCREFPDGMNTVFWGSATDLYKIVTSTPTSISSATQTNYNANASGIGITRLWNFEKYGDWIIAVNGYDPVQVRKTSAGNFQNLGGMPPSAKYCLVFGERLILGNLDLALGIGTTDTSVASSNFDYYIAGAYYNKTAVVVGTALAAGTIPQNKYGIYRFTIVAAGTITCTPAAANFTTGYDTEALAIAALPAVPANNINMGYITVMSTNAAGFVGNTDALMGGATGNPAAFTDYYIDTVYKSDKKLFWCGLGDLEDWTPSVTTGCDYQDMPDLESSITGIGEIANGFAITSKNCVGIGLLSRGADVFNFAIPEKDVGAQHNTVVSANRGIFFLAEQDVYFFNGTQAQPLGEGWRYTVLGNTGYSTTLLPGTYGSASMSVIPYYFGAHNPEEKLVVWNKVFGDAVPQKSLCIAYSYKYQQPTKFQHYVYATDATHMEGVYYSYYNKCLSCFRYDDATSTLVRYHINTASTGGDLTTGEIQLRDEKNFPVVSMITRVRPKPAGWSTAPAVTVSSRMGEADTPATVTATVQSKTGWVDLRSTGRYHKIKTTLGGGVIKSMEVEYEITGQK